MTRCPPDKGKLGQYYSPLSRIDTIRKSRHYHDRSVGEGAGRSKNPHYSWVDYGGEGEWNKKRRPKTCEFGPKSQILKTTILNQGDITESGGVEKLVGFCGILFC